LIFQRKRLRRARFRDAWFFLNETSTDTGRRVFSYQFPFQDQPIVQDLGKQGQQISIQGIVIGANYRLDAERLNKACEDPKSGKLFHPYYGEREVFCKSVKMSENSIEGGVVYFSMLFLETKETQKGVFGLQNIPFAGALLGNDALKKASEFLDQGIRYGNQGVEYLDQINDGILMIAEKTEQIFSPLLHAKDSLNNFASSLSVLRSAAQGIYTNGVGGLYASVMNVWKLVTGSRFDSIDPYNWTLFYPPDRYNGADVHPIIILSLGQQIFIIGNQASHVFSRYPTLTDVQKRLELQALKTNVDRLLVSAEFDPELFSILKKIQALCIHDLFESGMTWNASPAETEIKKQCLLLESWNLGGLEYLKELTNQYHFIHTCFPYG